MKLMSSDDVDRVMERVRMRKQQNFEFFDEFYDQIESLCRAFTMFDPINFTNPFYTEKIFIHQRYRKTNFL